MAIFPADTNTEYVDELSMLFPLHMVVEDGVIMASL